MEEDTDHVLVSKDGSWKVVSEIIDPSFGSASKTPEFREEKQNQSNPIGKNLSRDENYSQQISPTTNVEPSRVSMHQITSNSSSLAANCTNLNDQGKKVWIKFNCLLVLIADWTFFFNYLL